METSARNPLATISRAPGIRRTFGAGGGGPGFRWRHIAAAKQNALKITSMVAGAHPGGVSAFGRKDRAIGGQPSGAVGAGLDLRRGLFQLFRAFRDRAAVLGVTVIIGAHNRLLFHSLG